MEDWKQAAALAKFELRHSKKAVIPLGFMLIVYAFLMVYAAPQLVETIFYDLFFLIFIGIAALWARPKEFQWNQMRDGSWGTPYFVMLHQLPIRNEILIKNRFVIYYIYSIPAHFLFLFSMYAFSSEIRAILTFPEFVAFSVIWLSFGIYYGVQYPVTDILQVAKSSTVKMWILTVLFLASCVGGVILLQQLTGYGIVYNSMMLAKKWPLYSSVISILAAIICTKLALRQANQKIMKTDY